MTSLHAICTHSLECFDGDMLWFKFLKFKRSQRFLDEGEAGPGTPPHRKPQPCMNNNYILLPPGGCWLYNVISSHHIKWEGTQIWCRYLHITSVSFLHSMINQGNTTVRHDITSNAPTLTDPFKKLNISQAFYYKVKWRVNWNCAPLFSCTFWQSETH